MVVHSSQFVRIWAGSLVIALVTITTFNTAAHAATNTTTVSSAVGSTISLFTTNSTVNINTLPTSGGVQTIASDTVTVSANSSAGYTLQIGETAAATALTSGGNTIPASAGTFAAPVAMAVNTWGYRVDSIGGFGAGPTTGASNAAIGTTKFAAVPASGSPQTLKTTATTASSDTTSIWYGVATNTATPSGTYTNSVTYTATTN